MKLRLPKVKVKRPPLKAKPPQPRVQQPKRLKVKPLLKSRRKRPKQKLRRLRPLLAKSLRPRQLLSKPQVRPSSGAPVLHGYQDQCAEPQRARRNTF